MKAFLARRWFLLLLVAGIGLACLRPELLHPATRFLSPRWIVAPALFLMAWSLESRSLLAAVLRPLPALWAVVLSYGALPAAAWLLGWLLPEADFRIGLLIVASVPCTLASAVLWTRMAGGHEATALLVILLTTCTSWLITTAWLVSATGTEVHLEPVTLMRELLLVLVVPVGVGQLSRLVPVLAAAATRHRPGLGVASRLLIFLVILRAAVDVRLSLAARSLDVTVGSLILVGVVGIGIHLAGLSAGLWSSRGLGFDRPRQIAVAFACSQKTLPVALVVFDTYFQADYPLAIVPLVFYHVGQLIVDTFIADGLAGRTQETGIRRQGAGGRNQEAGIRNQEAGTQEKRTEETDFLLDP